MLWEKFQWIVPLYMKPISFQSKTSVVCSVTATVFIDFCLKKLNVLSQHIGKKTNEYLNSSEQITRNRNVDQLSMLTHWGRVTHICVSKQSLIGSDNGLSPDRRQAIICTNVGLLLIGPLETNFSEIFIEILIFSFKKLHLKMSSAKWRLFGLGLNELITS